MEGNRALGRRGQFVAALVLACAVLGVLGWWIQTSVAVAGATRDDPARPRGRATGAVALEPGAPAAAARATAPEAPAVDAAPEEAVPAEPMLSGRVLDESGCAVESATVRFGPASAESLLEEEAITEGVTDELGCFAIPIRLRHVHRFAVQGQLHALLERSIGPFRVSTDLGDLVVRRAVLLEGTVVDRDGQPIADAELIEFDPLDEEHQRHRRAVEREVLGTSDAEGRFSVRGPSVPGLVSLAARHPLHRIAAVQVRVLEGAAVTSGIRIPMEKGVVLRGVVSGLDPEEHRYVGELSVAVAPRKELESTREPDWDVSLQRVPVREDGRFDVGGLSPGETVVLAVWTGLDKSMDSRRRSPFHVVTALPEARGAAGGQEVELTYIRPGRLRARFVDAEGVPLERLTAQGGWSLVRSRSGPARVCATELELEDGVVEWEEEIIEGPVPAVEINAYVRDAWFEEEVLYWRGETIDLGTRTLEVDIEDAGVSRDDFRMVTVRLVDSAGAPIPFGSVQARSPGQKSSNLPVYTADEHGIYRFGVGRDETRLYRFDLVSHIELHGGVRPNFDFLASLAQWVEVPQGPDVTVDVVKPALAHAAVNVTLDGAALPRASVVFRLRDARRPNDERQLDSDPTPRGPRTDGRGRVHISDLPPGEWRVWVYHASLRMPEVFDVTLATGSNQVDLARVSTTITGRVVDANGAPVAGAIVRPDSTGAHAVDLEHMFDPEWSDQLLGEAPDTAALRDLRSARTDEAGRFRLDGILPDRSVAAIVIAPGFVSTRSESVVLRHGDERTLPDVVLQASGAVRIVLPALHDGSVRLAAPEGSANADHPGPWGSIAGERFLDGVPAGTWELKVEWYPAPYRSEEALQHSSTVTVVAGETTTVHLP